MTVRILIGRRIPRKAFQRFAHKLSSLLSFQENIWIIIANSMEKVKKRANDSGLIKCVKTKEIEHEDMFYDLEWIVMVFQGSKEAELDEIKDMNNFYLPLNKVMKKDIGSDANFSKHFKTKFLSLESLEKAYSKGFGSAENESISNKLLEIGILTSFSHIDDYDNREV
jgi:hypothetical protein